MPGALQAAAMLASNRRDAAPAVSVVVPVRNEAGNIAPLVAEIEAALADRIFEIVYVNDGSVDGGEAELLALMRERPWLRQIRHDPAFIPALIAALDDGAPRIGLIAGQRLGRKASGFKRMQSRIANAVRAGVLKDGTRDTGCGLKAFRRDLFLSLPYFDGLHRFLPALVRREGFGVGYVDVIDRPRRHGRSNYGFWDRLWVGILDLFGVWWLIRRRKRVPQSEEVIRAC
jgi:dolichol-phosphate mannosyltransferase